MAESLPDDHKKWFLVEHNCEYSLYDIKPYEVHKNAEEETFCSKKKISKTSWNYEVVCPLSNAYETKMHTSKITVSFVIVDYNAFLPLQNLIDTIQEKTEEIGYKFSYVWEN